MRLGLLAAVFVLSITADGVPGEAVPPFASAPAGDFEGFWTKSRSGRPIASFEGIPYAEAPVGKLRFQPAEPPRKLTGFQAKQPGPPCFQRQIMPKAEAEIWGKEDCLYLNVHVPEKVGRPEEQRLPVIFWIHGGGFLRGRGSEARPTYFLDKDVVLVTINYRLGSLGFLTTGDGVIPDNLGLRDQIAALKWVNENIVDFGGNPNLVTVMGHSAGSVSAQHLMLSPLAKNLFHRVISLSGSSLTPWAFNSEGEATEIRELFVEHLGCLPEPSKALLECLQTVPPNEVIAAEFIFKKFSGVPLRPFLPIVGLNNNAAVLPLHPKRLYEEGLFNDVPFISGISNGEGAFYTKSIFNNDKYLNTLNKRPVTELTELLARGYIPRKQLEKIRKFYFGSLEPLDKTNFMNATNMLTDDFFLWPLIQSHRYRQLRAKSPMYIYYFGYEGSQPTLANGRESDGQHKVVAHGDILAYLFPGSTNLSGNDQLISIALVDLFASFASDGVPSTNAMNIQWNPVTSKGSDVEYLHFDTISDIRMKKDLLPERWGFWDQLERDRTA